MRKSIISFVLACLVLLPLTAPAEQPLVMAGYEDQESYRLWSENLFFKRMEQLTGLVFEYRQAQSADGWEKTKAGFYSGETDLPQVLFKAELSPAETIDMLDAGILIDLAPLIQKNAPNLHRLLQENPDIKAAVMLPGGRIGALPYINLTPSQNCLWINQSWLDELKLDMPSTAEELAQVLLAFKTGDPNRNAKADEIPLAFLGAYDLKYLGHAFGLAANDFNVYAEGGQAKFMPMDPAFRDFIAWLRDLYGRGLLDRDGFTTADTLRRVTDEKQAVRYGALIAPLPTYILPAAWTDQYAVVPPFVYEGRQVYRSISPRATPGTFALTKDCEDPARMLQWVDYLYTDEGAILATSGQEGVDFLVDGDGTWRKTEAASQQSFLSSVSIMTGTTPPGVSNDAFQRRYNDQIVRRVSEQIDIVSEIARDPFPPFSLTRTQEEQIAPMQKAIGRYVDESIARFVTGEWETSDERFALFETELQNLGLEPFLSFWQAVLDGIPEEVR